MDAGSLREVDRVVAATDLVTVGAFRCAVEHPLFADSGPIRQACIVFPRTAVRITHEGRQGFVADSSIVTMYNAGQPYRRAAISRGGDRCDWFAFAPEVLREAVRSIDPQAADDEHRPVRFDRARAGARVYHRQRRIFLALSAGRLDPLQIDEEALGLLGRVLRSAYGTNRRGPEQPVAARAIAEATRALIGQRYRERLSLSTIGTRLGCSPYALCRAFHAIFGTTVHAHLVDLRLRASLERLESGAAITDVALDVGFSSHSHFTAAFRRHFGTWPSRFARFR